MFKTYKGIIYLLLTSAIWGFAIVALSIGNKYASPFTLQASQCFVGSIVLLPIIYIRIYTQK